MTESDNQTQVGIRQRPGRPKTWGSSVLFLIKPASATLGLVSLLGLIALGWYCARIDHYPTTAGGVLELAFATIALSFGGIVVVVLGVVGFSGLSAFATLLSLWNTVRKLVACRPHGCDTAQKATKKEASGERHQLARAVKPYLVDWVRWLRADSCLSLPAWGTATVVAGALSGLYARCSGTPGHDMFSAAVVLGSLPLIGRMWHLRRQRGLPAAGPVTFTLMVFAGALVALSWMNPGAFLDGAAYTAGLRGPAGVTLYLRRDEPAVRGLMAKGWAKPLEPDLAVMALPDLRIVWQGPGEELALQWREEGRLVRTVLPKAAVVATVQAERRRP